MYVHNLLHGAKGLASVFVLVRALAQVMTHHVGMHGPGHLGALFDRVVCVHVQLDPSIHA